MTWTNERDAWPGTDTRRGTGLSATWNPTRPRPSSSVTAGRGRRTTTARRSQISTASAVACVLYDQIGCGKSQHLPDAPADFWTPQLFKDELGELTRHLGIADRYAVVGQSWGGMLAMEHALDHPVGLRGIVVADSPASMTLWVSEANRLREDLPPDVQVVLTKHEEAGTTDDPEYETAVRVFYDRHLCRVPWPDCAAAQLRSDRRRPDRVPHDERAERVPRDRIVEGVGHHRSTA